MKTETEKRESFDNFIGVGNVGLQGYEGFIEEAYNASLYWPSVYPLYNRLRRSDPEVTVVRNGYGYLGSGVEVEFDMPENPTQDDERARDFLLSVFDDIDGGFSGFVEKMVTQAPFMGWASWNVQLGRRRKGWSVGGWKSNYDDGLIGVRKLEWRDQSSFREWLTDASGKYIGWLQQTLDMKGTKLFFDDLLHITFGDNDNPEGHSPLEAVWRLERIKYGLEVVQGMGFEHSAGYLSVHVEESPITNDSKSAIKQAAINIATAKQGNYAAFPKGVTGAMVDVPFSSASTLLEAIKYYGILKLTIYNMQWVALSATSGSGSFAAMSDSSSMYIHGWNAMMRGFANQINDQLIKRLFDIPANKNAFLNLTRLPRLKFKPIEKSYSLQELSSFVSQISSVVPIGEDDIIAIRKHSGILPTSIPNDGKLKEAVPQFSEFAMPDDFSSIKRDYQKDIQDALNEYERDKDKEQFRKAMKVAIVVAFLLTVRNAYNAQGAGNNIPSETMAWLLARQTAEVAYAENLLDAVDAGQNVGDRPELWAANLISIRNEALLRALPKAMLTFGGEDGDESCSTCQSLKGRRAPAEWWIEKGLIPGVNGNDRYECGGWNCHHKLFDDDGNVVTL